MTVYEIKEVKDLITILDDMVFKIIEETSASILAQAVDMNMTQMFNFKSAYLTNKEKGQPLSVHKALEILLMFQHKVKIKIEEPNGQTLKDIAFELIKKINESNPLKCVAKRQRSKWQ